MARQVNRDDFALCSQTANDWVPGALTPAYSTNQEQWQALSSIDEIEFHDKRLQAVTQAIQEVWQLGDVRKMPPACCHASRSHATMFNIAASIAAAVAAGFSIGKRWVPSSIMMRPLLTFSVNAMPTCFISCD